VAWDIEGTEEFHAWFSGLASAERISVAAKIDLLHLKEIKGEGLI